MTDAEKRAEILSKDFLDIRGIMFLLGIKNESDASRIIQHIKRKSDRLGIRGKVHLQDYLECYNLPPDRYLIYAPNCLLNGQKIKEQINK